jgi:hypothetical protein
MLRRDLPEGKIQKKQPEAEQVAKMQMRRRVAAHLEKARMRIEVAELVTARQQVMGSPEDIMHERITAQKA